MSLPSTRECMHRLDRMRDTGQVIADLDELNLEVWTDEPAWELVAASKRLAELHELCLQLAANLNGGFGVPQTPALKPKPLDVASAPQKPPLSTWSNVASAQREFHAAKPQMVAPVLRKKHGRQTPVAPAGMVTAAEFAAALGITLGVLYQHIGRSVPSPTLGGGRGNPSYWDASVVGVVRAARAQNPHVARAAKRAA